MHGSHNILGQEHDSATEDHRFTAAKTIGDKAEQRTTNYPTKRNRRCQRNEPAFLRNVGDRRVRGSVARGIWVIFGCSSRKISTEARRLGIGMNLGGRAGLRFTEADVEALRRALTPPPKVETRRFA